MTINVVIGYYLQSTEKTTLSAIFVSLRSFVLLLSATIILGLAFGMNGIWASYTVAEVLAFIIIVSVLRAKKVKNNTETVENATYCLTFNCSDGNLEDFISYAEAFIRENNFSNEVCDKVSLYFASIREFYSAQKSKYIEIEMNTIDNKIIIRDNLKRTTISEDAPVLGWNRLCVKQGE